MVSSTHQAGCGGLQTLASYLCAPSRTGPLSAGTSDAPSRGPLSHQHNTTVRSSTQTQQFRPSAPGSEAGASAGGKKCGGCHVNPQLTKSPAAAVCLHRCRRPPAGDDPPDLPASELAASPVRPFSKVTQQVWSGMSVSLPLPCSVLVVLPSCVDLFGSTLSQGASRTSPCGSLLFLFAASVAFYPSLTGRSLTAFLLRRPSSLSPTVCF